MGDVIDLDAERARRRPPAEGGCECCGAAFAERYPDPWLGRLDGYCDDCAAARCDAYPDTCPNAPRP